MDTDCPACHHGPDLVVSRPHGDYPGRYYMCQGCGFRSEPRDSPSQAIEEWRYAVRAERARRRRVAGEYMEGLTNAD